MSQKTVNIDFDYFKTKFKEDNEIMKRRKYIIDIFISDQYLQEYMFAISNENIQEVVEINNFYRKLKNFNIREISKINKDQFFSPTEINFFEYFTKSVIYFEKENYNFFRRIRYWLRNLKKIASGSYGKVYTSSLKGTKEKLFLLKFFERKYKEDAFHEYFVSHFFINKLRKICPNFSMTFGYMECSSPSDIEFGTYITPVPCIIYEYIYPATILYEFLKECNFLDFLTILLQVCFSLYIACKKYGFTHNDLHTANILIKKYKEQLYIPYKYENKKIFIKTNLIAIIIDYGFSRIEIPEKYFGPYGIPRRAIFEYTKAYPLKDIFNLISNSIFILHDSKLSAERKEMINNLFMLMKFFFSTDLDFNIIKEIENVFHYYPFIKEFEGIKGITAFIKFLYSQFGDEIKKIIIDEKNIPSRIDGLILDCKYTRCLTIDEIFEKVYKKLPIGDIFYYFDIHKYNPNVRPPEKVIRNSYETLVKSIESIFNIIKEYEGKTITNSKFINLYIQVKDIIELANIIEYFRGIENNIKMSIEILKRDINKINKDFLKKKNTLLIKEKNIEDSKNIIIPPFLI